VVDCGGSDVVDAAGPVAFNEYVYVTGDDPPLGGTANCADALPDVHGTTAGDPLTAGVTVNVQLVASLTDALTLTVPPVTSRVDGEAVKVPTPGGSSGQMAIERLAVASALARGLVEGTWLTTFAVNVDVPVVVGVPEITPVVLFRVSPGGRAP
jgi:hypothetical protein